MPKSLRGIRISTLFLSSIVLLHARVFTHAQEPVSEIPTIKVDVALVTTEVTVLGTAAADLRAEDFVVYDNGVVQQITHFSRDKVPLAVALLIDRSTSIKPYLRLLQKAAISALGHLKPEDPVVLFAFADDLLKLSDLTTDRNRITGIIDKLTIGSGTNIYDSVSDVADYLRKRAPHHRRAIILVSDSCHTVPSRISGDDARVEVLESSATLYSIKTPGDNYAANIRVRDPGCYDSIAMVRNLAEETGGQVLDVGASKSLQAALENAISHLRLQYTLGFSPSGTGQEGSFHKLTVKLAAANRCPGCRILSRSGYYAGSSPAPLLNEIRLAGPVAENKTDLWIIRRKIEAAETIDLELPDIPFVAMTSRQKDSAGKPWIKIDLQIGFSGIGFRKIGDKHACTLHIAIFSTDEKGHAVEPQFQTLEGMLREETYNQARKTGVSVSITIPAKGSKQDLKIVLYDEIGDTFGSRYMGSGLEN